jgi:NCS1 family nucleobase:cation symporter-1
MTDYILTKGNVFISHLYDGTKHNKHYYYMKGWNVQAIIAYICGIALPFPGFVGSLGAPISTGGTDLGHLGWILSFSTSFVIYWVLCTFWPTRNQKIIKEMGLGWEEMSGDIITAPDGTQILESGRNVVAVEAPIHDASSGSAAGKEAYITEKVA